jgi:hypothetical protein
MVHGCKQALERAVGPGNVFTGFLGQRSYSLLRESGKIWVWKSMICI